MDSNVKRGSATVAASGDLAAGPADDGANRTPRADSPLKNASEVAVALEKSARELEALDAPVVSAHLDAAIAALCRQFHLTRDGTEME